MIQCQFPNPVVYDKKVDTLVILCLLVHLHNFQAVNFGINTILNSYMEEDTSFFHHDNILIFKLELSFIIRTSSIYIPLLSFYVHVLMTM